MFMKKKILLADDEPHMMKLLELSLRKGGYTLIKAVNGQEAVEKSKTEMPDLIVLDVVMPGMDGLKALELIKSDESTCVIPVIMLTARGHHLTRETAANSGAHDFLTKPFSPMELLKRVKLLLDDSLS
jgi:DNA-binding response OmpR family regulator